MNDIKTVSGTAGHYKYKVTSNFDWSDCKSVRLGVSLGGRNHMGDRLAALLEWASMSFETVHVFVADSLQRHNIMFSSQCGAAEAMAAGIQAGDDWLASQESILSRFNITKVHRWSELRNSTTDKIDQQLHDLFDEDEIFRVLLEYNIKSAWLRKVKTGVFGLDTSFDTYFEHSKNYILEELAVMSEMHKIFPGVEAYPKEHLKVTTAPERLLIKGLPQTLRNYPLLEILFKRRGATQDAGERTGQSSEALRI